MTRSEHDIFDDHVAVLVRQFGFDLDQVSERDRRRLLTHAWQRKLGEHEAAAAVGFSYVQILLERDVEHARVLLDRIGLVLEQWRIRGLVDPARTAALEREARAALHAAGR
jgi:hypothetical protein